MCFSLTAPIGNGTSGSDSPTTSSQQPSLVADQHKWTMFMSKVNLPAALNDPGLGRREMDIFSKTWGEAFERAEVKPSPHLPEITREHFRRYLKKVGPRLKAHRAASAQAAESAQAAQDKLPTEAFPLLHIRQQADKARAELEVIPKVICPFFLWLVPQTEWL